MTEYTGEIRPLGADLAILKKLNLEHQPVGMKFLFEKPLGVKRLEKNLAICLMPEEVQSTGNTRQAEIVLRSYTYSTGAMYISKTTPVIGCAWTFVYPYITGELNYVAEGLCFGHLARVVGKPGEISISIPFNLLDTIIGNLNEMTWDLPAYSDGREGYNKRFKEVTSGRLISRPDYSRAAKSK